MPRGNKSSYINKQQRSRKYIEENWESREARKKATTQGLVTLVNECHSSHFAIPQVH